MVKEFRGSVTSFYVSTAVVFVVMILMIIKSELNIWLGILAVVFSFLVVSLFRSGLYYYIVFYEDELTIKNLIRPWTENSYKFKEIKEVGFFESLDNCININGDKYACKSLSLEDLEEIKKHLEKMKVRVRSNLDRYDKI